MASRSFGRTVGTAASLTTVLAGIVGGAYTLIQYRANQQIERKQAALQYAQVFGSGDLSSAQDAINEFWSDAQRRARLTVLSQSQDEHPLNEYIVGELDSNIGIRRETSLVIDFLGTVQFCADAGICDGATVTRFFGPYAARTWNLDLSFITATRVRVGDSSYGAGVYALKVAYCATPAGQKTNSCGGS